MGNKKPVLEAEGGEVLEIIATDKPSGVLPVEELSTEQPLGEFEDKQEKFLMADLEMARNNFAKLDCQTNDVLGQARGVFGKFLKTQSMNIQEINQAYQAYKTKFLDLIQFKLEELEKKSFSVEELKKEKGDVINYFNAEEKVLLLDAYTDVMLDKMGIEYRKPELEIEKLTFNQAGAEKVIEQKKEKTVAIGRRDVEFQKVIADHLVEKGMGLGEAIKTAYLMIEKYAQKQKKSIDQVEEEYLGQDIILNESDKEILELTDTFDSRAIAIITEIFPEDREAWKEIKDLPFRKANKKIMGSLDKIVEAYGKNLGESAKPDDNEVVKHWLARVVAETVRLSKSK